LFNHRWLLRKTVTNDSATLQIVVAKRLHQLNQMATKVVSLKVVPTTRDNKIFLRNSQRYVLLLLQLLAREYVLHLGFGDQKT
jgi:hypothetical protein